MLWLDYETRSRCDLPSRGVYNYARDPSTQVLCMSYAFDDEDVVTWLADQPFPDRVANYTGQIRAHNAAFERLIWWYVLCADKGIPEPRLEQFYCTAAQARANCAPGSLEDVGRFAGSSMRKDHRGNQLIRLLSIPRVDGTFNNDPQLMAEMVAYCEQDVRTMRTISKAMRDLSEQELLDYHVNERINDRGVLLDKPLAESAIRYASHELGEIESLVDEVTNGEITSVRSPRMRDWVLERVGPQAKKLMESYKDGEKKYSIDKTVRANLLILAEENHDEIPPHVADVIQCADDLWASSVAKFKRAADLADEEDHRVRGAFVFAGGSATGRASSYGLQVHNFPRRCASDPEAVRQAMVRSHAIVPTYGKRVTDVLKGMLRPALIPERGKSLVVADWAAVEARVTPWASAHRSSGDKLELFRTGEDVYKVNAAKTFNIPITKVDKDQRQIGKVQELACFTAKTKVLTSNGVKAIVDVLLTDKLWDGEKWVGHQGVIYKGQRKVINVCGLQVTEDHLFLVKHEWKDAKTVRMSKNILTQALETGSANLPYWVMKSSKAAFAMSAWSRFSVLVERNPTWFSFITFLKARLQNVMLALEKRLVIGEKIFLNTLKPAPMMTIGGAYLTDYLLANNVAITQKIEDTQTTGGEALRFMSHGAPIKRRFYGMLFSWKDGINRIWSWIGLTSIRDMNLVIYGLLAKKITATTSDPCEKCNPTFSNLKPVYDILNSGNLNRFTVVCDDGYLIAHNCGFAGGVGAFAAMGRIYGIMLPEPEAKRMVNGWRLANPWAMPYWSDLEDSYTRAMRNKGHEFTAGRVTYLYDGLHLWYALPSGRVLCYPFAQLDSDGVSYAKASWKPAADAKEWPRARLWKGLACENITQAIANDLLRHSLRHLDDVVLHVHDEIVIETAEPEAVKAEMERVMCTPPAWATGLPLDVEVAIMSRYGK